MPGTGLGATETAVGKRDKPCPLGTHTLVGPPSGDTHWASMPAEPLPRAGDMVRLQWGVGGGRPGW